MPQAKQSVVRAASYRSQASGVVAREHQAVYRVASVAGSSSPPHRISVLISTNTPQRPQASLRALFEQVQVVDAAHAATAGYELRNSERIRQFLHDHAYLLPLLIEARGQISIYFPDAPLALEVVSDPEGEAESLLVVFILTATSPESALERLDAIDQNWWLNTLPRAQHKLSINVEFT